MKSSHRQITQQPWGLWSLFCSSELLVSIKYFHSCLSFRRQALQNILLPSHDERTLLFARYNSEATELSISVAKSYKWIYILNLFFSRRGGQDRWKIWVSETLPAPSGVSELWLPLLWWLPGQRELGCVCCSLLQVVRHHIISYFRVCFDELKKSWDVKKTF